MDKSLNNHTLGLALMLLGALLCLALPWGSITITKATGMSALFNGREVTLTGTNGTVSPLGIPIPTWLIAIISAVGSFVSILQIRSIIGVPKVLVAMPNILSGLLACMAVILFASNGSPGIGSILILIVSILSVILLIRSPHPA